MTTPANSEDFSPRYDPQEQSLDAPADAVAQARPVEPGEDDDDEIHRGLEVNEYDAAEQAHVVILDDDYR